MTGCGAKRSFVFIQRLATGREWHEMESVVTAREMTKSLSVARCGRGTPRIVRIVLAVLNVVALAVIELRAEALI
jgi:hypothetical protein